MSMLPPGPPGPRTPEFQAASLTRTYTGRKHDVAERVAKFFDVADQGIVYSLDYIGKHCVPKLTSTQVSGAMSRVVPAGIAVRAGTGLYMRGQNAGKGINPSRQRRFLAASERMLIEKVSSNGPSMGPDAEPEVQSSKRMKARVRARAAEVQDRQILLFEVLRTREDGTVVLVGENGEIATLTYYDLD